MPLRVFRPAVLFLAAALMLSVPSMAQDSKENADFKLALNLYNDGLYDLAGEQLRQFIAAFPATSQGIEARFYLGLTQLKLKNYDDARLTFQSFALTYQDHPKAPEAWMHTGEAYAALGNVHEAALAFERVKVFHPKSRVAPQALLQAARYFSLGHDRENSRRVLRIILQEYASSDAVMEARTLMGRVYFEEGNLAQAQAELRRVIDGDPSPEARAQALLLLGNINLAAYKTDEALSQYQEIISEYRSSGAVQGALVNQGRILALEGKPDEAADSYRKAAALKSGTDSALTRLAMLGIISTELQSKDYPATVAACEKFLARYPSDSAVTHALWNLALANSLAKRFAASNDACRRLLMGARTDRLTRQRALIRRARNAVEQKNASAAIQEYQTFAEQYPDDPALPQVQMALAGLQERQIHDYRKAASTYEAVAQRPGTGMFLDDALMGAARCYEQLHEPDRARMLYLELIARCPSSALRQDAERRVTMIDIFEAKDKDAGLEKLALLVGDVVGDKDRTGMAFRLGDIYFHQLKNYEAAAQQFTNAINSGITDSRFVEALFLRAKSYEYLTLKDEAYRQRAIEAYSTFLQSYPADARASDAAVTLFFLRATTADTAMALLRTFPNARHRDTLLLHLATLLEATDTTGKALNVYVSVADNYPQTPSGLEATYHAAMLFAAYGHADSAQARAENYLAFLPGGPHAAEILSRLADVAEQKNNYGLAATLLRKLTGDLGYAGKRDTLRARLASDLMSAGEYSGAESLYGDMAREQENDPLNDRGIDPQILLWLARAHQLADHLPEAKACLYEALGSAPPPDIAGQAYTMLGWIAKAEGSTDGAASYFRLAEKAAPGRDASREVADLLFESGKFADAIRQYAGLVQAAGSDSERQYYDMRIILAAYKSDNLTAAQKGVAEYKKRYGAINETMAAFELERGSYFFRKEDYANALQVFNGIVQHYEGTPSSPLARYWIGKALQQSGDLPHAIATMEDLLKDFPDGPIAPRVHVALGNLYYETEKWPESIRNYRAVVHSASPDPTLLPFAMSNLIETYEAAGVNDAALALTRRYLERYPNAEDSFDKKIKIGILYDRLGYYDQAVLHLQGLLDEAGSDLEGEIRYYIAEANYNKGDYQQAILDFLKVPYLVTKKGKIDWTANSLYMSGQSYEKMGRYDQAQAMYQQILERQGIDDTFKAAARKEIERVKLILKKTPTPR